MDFKNKSSEQNKMDATSLHTLSRLLCFFLFSLQFPLFAMSTTETRHKSNVLYMTEGIPLDFVRDKNFLVEKRSMPRTAALPVLVKVHIAIESITDITNIDSTIDLYMTQYWNDGLPKNKSLKLSGEDISNYSWTPDLYFILAKTVVYNTIAQSLVFDPDGEVTFDQKIRVTAPCKPEIWYFPFDNTTCRIIIASYGFSQEYINLTWTYGGIEFPVPYDELSELG